MTQSFPVAVHCLFLHQLLWEPSSVDGARLLVSSTSSSLQRLTDLRNHTFRPQSPPVISGWKERVPGCHSRGQRGAMPSSRGEAQSAPIITKLNLSARVGRCFQKAGRLTSSRSVLVERVLYFFFKLKKMKFESSTWRGAATSGRLLPILATVTCNICRRSSLRSTLSTERASPPLRLFPPVEVRVGGRVTPEQRRRRFKSLFCAKPFPLCPFTPGFSRLV